ncbi:hypothetical protein TNCV_1444031 [Trichonephila clavipes]|nr:hypothetical protein TNCV_1444031 [Trichonephila clavipes]
MNIERKRHIAKSTFITLTALQLVYEISLNMLGKTPKETYVILICASEVQALSMMCVYKGFTRFREDWESVDNSRSGRPTTSINRESVRQIVTQNLGMRKTCRRLVTHHLTDDQKQACLKASQDLSKQWMRHQVS